MSFTMNSLIRLIVVTVVCANAVAIAVNRLDPPTPEVRLWLPSDETPVNGYFLHPRHGNPRLLEASAGELRDMLGDSGVRLEHASLSPWMNATGARQVVGRSSAVIDSDVASMPTGSALIRLSLPDGKVIDRVESEAVPIAPPAWFPDTTARVVFPGGDGRLYRLNFEDDSLGEPENTPVPLRWGVEKPGGSDVIMTEVCWPTHPAFSDRLIVSLSKLESTGQSQRRFGPARLYWMRIDARARTILGVGEVMAMPPGSPEESVRSPQVVLGPDRAPLLLYFAKTGRGQPWNLRMAPLRFETEGGPPETDYSSAVTLTDHCVPTNPAVSQDGRWLAFLREAEAGRMEVVQLDLRDPLQTGLNARDVP